MSDKTEPVIDWSKHFRAGDVVRGKDGTGFGVVRYVGRYSEDPPKYELMVDEPKSGVGIWEPSDAVLANDAGSIEEAKRLGLLQD
jgi:hypothetical protein